MAGRARVPPPWLVSALHHHLLETVEKKFQDPGWLPDPEYLERDDDGYEHLILRPWLMNQLKMLRITCLSLVKGKLIDPLLDHVEVSKGGMRKSSAACRKYSLSLRLYDLATDFLAKPVLSLPATVDGACVLGREG